jgi:cytochrome c oxidase cbb3-type subunit III
MDPSQTSQDNQPVLREHVFDGIQEYDQKLPNWWLFTWYICIIWFVIAWVAYYQMGRGKSDIEKIDAAIAVVEASRAKALESVDDEKLWAMSKDPKVVAAGEATYKTTCVACHAPDLSAHIAGVKLPGMPLNDKEWKHGGNPTQLLTIVRKGAPDLTKGMPPWEPQLGITRVIEVVAFVLSKHDKNDVMTLSADSPLKAGAAPSATPAPANAPPAAKAGGS